LGNQLKSKKILEQVFEKGQKSFIYPIKIMYLKNELAHDEMPQLKYTVTAPKRLFKRAVDRNRLKRQMRAAVNAALEIEKFNWTSSFSLVFIYVSKDMLDFKVITHSVKKQLHKIISK